MIVELVWNACVVSAVMIACGVLIYAAWLVFYNIYTCFQHIGSSRTCAHNPLCLLCRWRGDALCWCDYYTEETRARFCWKLPPKFQPTDMVTVPSLALVKAYQKHMCQQLDAITQNKSQVPIGHMPWNKVADRVSIARKTNTVATTDPAEVNQSIEFLATWSGCHTCAQQLQPMLKYLHHTEARPTESHEEKAVHDAPGWANVCEHCTYENPPESRNCNMCDGGLKPPCRTGTDMSPQVACA